MTELPILYALSAGMLATVNPCGAAMLPAYVSYQLGAEDPQYKAAPLTLRTLRALGLGLSITAGFVVLFSMIGLVLSLGGRVIMSVVPWAAVGIGIVLIGLGVGTLLGRAPHLTVLSSIHVPSRVGWRGVFLFGIGYAIASLSCTLPIFLVVVGSSLATGGILSAFSMFLGYSLGMGAVLTALTVGVVLFKGAVARGLTYVVPYVERLSAIMLIGAGGYILYYWLWYAR